MDRKIETGDLILISATEAHKILSAKKGLEIPSMENAPKFVKKATAGENGPYWPYSPSMDAKIKTGELVEYLPDAKSVSAAERLANNAKSKTEEPRTQEAKAPSDKISQIIEAMRQLDPESDYTVGTEKVPSAPKIDALVMIVGVPVTAKERDAAYKIYQAEAKSEEDAAAQVSDEEKEPEGDK